MTLIFHVLSVSLKLNKWVKSVSPAALRSLYTLICSLGVPVGANLHLSPHYWSFILVITTESFFFSFFLTTRVLFCFSHCFLNGKGSPFFLFPRVSATDLFVIEHILNTAGQLLYNFAIISAVKSEICLFFFSLFCNGYKQFSHSLHPMIHLHTTMKQICLYLLWWCNTCINCPHFEFILQTNVSPEWQSNYLMLLTVAAISYIAQLALQLEVQSRGESVCG